ncbi:MAG: ROK family protein [Thermoanaerobaculum sp.]
MSEARAGTPVLLGDVGGTKTLLALGTVTRGRVQLQEATVARLSSTAYPHLRELVAAYLAAHPEPRPHLVALGVPGPVVAGYCRTTNLPWELEERDLAAAWGVKRVLLLNDLEALGWAFSAAPYPATRVLREGKTIAAAPKLVIAVGTGLGAAVAIPAPGGPVVLATEAGHMDFAATTAEDWALARFLRASEDPLSYEHLVSGPGLARLYRYYASDNEDEEFRAAPDPGAWVVARAQADPACRQAVTTCIRILGVFAGNIALATLPLAGVFFSGSVALALSPRLAAPEFFAAFERKSQQRQLLANVPLYLVADPLAPLLGCARALAPRTGEGATEGQRSPGTYHRCFPRRGR